MNKLIIIGNLTSDPTIRQVSSSNGPVNVCSFTVAVNRRRGAENIADFFRVTTWRGLADNCAKYLAKGRKVAVEGSVSVSTYTSNDGKPRANLEVNAENVEFLTREQRGEAYDSDVQMDAQSGMTVVNDEGLPF